MKNLIYSFISTPTSSEIAFDLGTSFLFTIKKTRNEYALYQDGVDDAIMSISYDSNMSNDKIAKLLIQTVELITGVTMND